MSTARLPTSRRAAAVAGPVLTGLALAAHAAAAPSGPAAWTQLPADRPLGGHSAVYDPAQRRMVLHGGERDASSAPLEARQLDLSPAGRGWSALGAEGEAPRTRLPGRGLQGVQAVLDPGERTLFTACDCANGHPFLLDLARRVWSVGPGVEPIDLWYYVLTYDAPRDRAVLYGGLHRGEGEPADAGWAYDLSPNRTGWRPLPAAPFEIVYQAHDLDRASGHVVAFGGLDAVGGPTASLWRLDLAAADEPGAWRDISALAGAGPPARIGATLTFDPETSTAVLFGGYDFADDLSDAWLLDYADPEAPTWRRLQSDGPAPEARAGHSAVWDAASARVVVYGGVQSRGPTFLDDTWALDPGVRPTPTPSASATGTATAASTPTPTGEVPRPTIFLPVGYRTHWPPAIDLRRAGHA